MKVRRSEKSTVASPGPRRMLRPALPHVYGGGMANALTLNHSCGPGLAILGLQTTSGLSSPKFPPVLPVLLLSNDNTGVNGWPNSAVTMPLTWRFLVQRDLTGIW